MNRKHFFLLLSLFLIFQSCTSVTFEEPQPSDEANLENIPVGLRGNYINLSDSSVFIVSEKVVIRNYQVVVFEPLSKIDSLYKLTADTVLIISEVTSVKAKIINDTVCANFTYSDTIFNMSPTNILRKYKDNYFMNVQEDEGWEVIKIQQHKTKLFVATISSREDVRKLRKITEISDTTVTVFKPTPIQFKKFVRKKGFSNEEVLVRIQ